MIMIEPERGRIEGDFSRIWVRHHDLSTRLHEMIEDLDDLRHDWA